MLLVIITSILNFTVGSYPQDLCQYLNASTDIATRQCAATRLEDTETMEYIELTCIISTADKVWFEPLLFEDLSKVSV